MANSPSFCRTFAPVTSSVVQHQEHRFHLYLHEPNEARKHHVIVVPPIARNDNTFGITAVTDWDVLDRPEIGATVIGRLQGVQISADSGSRNRFLSSNLALTDHSLRFKGSTLSVQGRLGFTFENDEGEWAVVGGTGELACAQGTVAYKQVKICKGDRIIEIKIRVICPTFPMPNPIQKVGPWGGNGGTPYEIQEDEQLPKRLESVKIYHDDNVIQSISFSYLDQADQRRTVGRDDREGGSVIQFGPRETVKEIFGSTGNYEGHTVVTSLAIVNNLDNCVLYGKQPPGPGDTPFREIAPENHSIVGFYWRLGEVVHQIGVYVRHNND